MADFNLPPPAQPVVEQPAPVATGGAVAVVANEPAPLTVENNEAALFQRVSNALDLLGIDPAVVKSHVVAQLEACAAAYIGATVGNDRNVLQAQGVRLLAGLHALFAQASKAPSHDEVRAIVRDEVAKADAPKPDSATE